MKENLLEIITDFSKEKGLDQKAVIKLVEESLVQAAQRKLPYQVIEGQIDAKTGKINLYHFKEVVELVEDPYNEISLEDVMSIDPDAELGDEVEYDISDKEFQRIAHSTRPIIFGSLKEAERQMVVGTFAEKVGEILTGTVLRVEPNGRIAISFQNKVEAYLFRREQIYGEAFTFGDHVRVFLMDVNDNPHKASQLTVSRTHPGLLIKLFEMEVPEIYDGIVKVVSAAREPGRRAKISVYSTDEDVDPVGSCVGMRGSRVQTIVSELNGEKIDIVRWSEDVETYVCNSLAPAEVESIEVDEDSRKIDVVVSSSQLSLAIGHKGQNVRLASKLTGYKINISAPEGEQLSIDEQLKQEFTKSRDNGENAVEEMNSIETDQQERPAVENEEADQQETLATGNAETDQQETQAVESGEADQQETQATGNAETDQQETQAVESEEADQQESEENLNPKAGIQA